MEGTGLGYPIPGGVLGGNTGEDAIQEFSVLTSNFSAAYGKKAGAIVNIATKSGTNQIHGTAYEYLRNSHLDARNFFDQTIGPPPFKRNQFGGSLGGPIKRDNSFFFVNYEGLRQGLGVSKVAVVPDANAHLGLLPCAQAPTVACNAGLATVGVAAAVKPYLNTLFPLPNGQSFGDGTGAYSSNPTHITNLNLILVRFDQRISDKDSFFGRFNYDKSDQSSPSYLTQIAPQYFVAAGNHDYNATLEENLRYAKPDATREQLERACRLAQMHDVIAALPEGYATVVGERGYKFSGGEKQRLAIAGLLALRPPVMVLDEPTTDLDPAGRAEVLRTLAGLRADGLALLVIEHDTAAAADADLLLVLREGRVVARGAPRVLLADVEACTAAGIRAPDACRVFVALGLPDPPLDVATAAERLRAAGATPKPPRFLPPPRPAGPPLIDVRGLRHRYPTGHEALAEVSLAIRPGEFVALVGRNGSGKTTLAKHLNGLLEPTEGAVRLEGRDLRSLALEELAQRVGYVFQDPDHQLFAATVGEEVAFGPRNLGLAPTQVEERVAEALAAVDLHERDADPFLLDKGARQRLAVASILALRPDVLVLDEPTTGLDHLEQERMLELLARLHTTGRTIVIVTHTPWVIATHARRVVLLAEGRLRYDGPLRPFFANEELLAAAAFRAPDVTRLGRCLGCTPLTVEEFLAWTPRRS